jgi:hypothetical protein
MSCIYLGRRDLVLVYIILGVIDERHGGHLLQDLGRGTYLYLPERDGIFMLLNT